MKFLYISFLLLLSSTITSAQQYNWFDFDTKNSAYKSWISFDTTHHNNSWQVGRPQKTLFDSAYSLPNAIITDTINSYPTNDTSIFYIKFTGIDRRNNQILRHLTFNYQLDIDSGEIAKIEILADSGRRWIDLFKGYKEYYLFTSYYYGIPHYYNSEYANEKHLRSTKGKGWVYCVIDFNTWGQYSSDVHPFDYGAYPYKIVMDTTWLKFTFISDNIQTNKEGWMIDDIHINKWTTSIKETKANNNIITVYPNPFHDHIYIKRNTATITKETASIYNIYGQKVFHTNSIPTNGYLKLNLPPGIYTLRYSNGKEHAVTQLILQ